MYDYQTVKLMHPHGDQRFPMEEKEPHDPADLDPERGWVPGAKIFRCTGCDQEIVVVPPGRDILETQPT